MIIKRFENNNSSETLSKFIKIEKLKEQLQKEQYSLLPKIREYFILNPHLIKENISKNEEFRINSFLFSTYPEKTLIINYFTSYAYYDNPDVTLNGDQFEDFLYFMDNSEIYKQSKKYNL